MNFAGLSEHLKAFFDPDSPWSKDQARREALGVVYNADLGIDEWPTQTPGDRAAALDAENRRRYDRIRRLEEGGVGPPAGWLPVAIAPRRSPSTARTTLTTMRPARGSPVPSAHGSGGEKRGRLPDGRAQDRHLVGRGVRGDVPACLPSWDERLERLRQCAGGAVPSYLLGPRRSSRRGTSGSATPVVLGMSTTSSGGAAFGRGA